MHKVADSPQNPAALSIPPKSKRVMAPILRTPRMQACMLLSAFVTGSNAIQSADLESATNAPPPGFFTRFDRIFREDLGTQAYTPPSTDTNAPAAPVTRRGYPAPFDAPPYPNGEWQIGGTEIIGDANTIPLWPLTAALQDGPNGEWWKKSRVNIYGWVDVSGNVSSSHNPNPGPVTGQGANFPEIYDQRANRIELNQVALYFERTADEFQTDHVDWGFRVMGVYGLDYRYMISRGLFDAQLLNHNHYYGYDMPMTYFTVYFPKVAEGMNLTVGRIISEADIEAQLAPNNLMSSHSLLYSFDPYTQEGIFSSIKLNKNWVIQAGLSCGGDVALWQRDPGRQPTGSVMAQWQSSDGKWSFYGGANQFNNGTFGYNNLQQYVGTITYKITTNIWTSHETWYMYQRNATTGPTADVPYQNGFFPVKPGYAPEWATLNYTMFRLGHSTFFTVRNEFFDDIVGNRTGYASRYYEGSIGLTWWPNKLMTIRPELRFDHAFDALSYDSGTRKNQFTAQVDVILHF